VSEDGKTKKSDHCTLLSTSQRLGKKGGNHQQSHTYKNVLSLCDCSFQSKQNKNKIFFLKQFSREKAARGKL